MSEDLKALALIEDWRALADAGAEHDANIAKLVAELGPRRHWYVRLWWRVSDAWSGR